MKQKVIILKGLPASGKSTWAKELIDKNPNVYKRINKDDLRAMLDNGKHSKGREQFIIHARDVLIDNAIHKKFSVIIDDTNLNPIHEEQIRKRVELWNETQAYNIEIEVKFFDFDVNECIKRDRLRGDKAVGEHAIRDMYRRWLKPTQKVVLKQDPSLPKAIICDVDGTLAHMVNRGPYDTTKYMDDEIDIDIMTIVNSHAAAGHKVIIMSGRDEQFKDVTRAWLTKHEVFFDEIWMRPNNDRRPDYIVKEELYDRYVLGQYNVKLVLDDRNQVVNMWRDRGLKCLQVADGDF